MPWLEVPDWRAWESYARPMTDSPDIIPDPAESLEAVRSLDSLAALGSEQLAELGFIAPDADLEAGNSAADDVPPPTDADDTTDQANEPIVITGTMHIVLPDDFLGPLAPPADFVEGSIDLIDPDATPDFPVGPAPVVKEHIPHPPLPEPPAEATHMPPTAGESDDERARRLEKASLSRSERLRRGW